MPTMDTVEGAALKSELARLCLPDAQRDNNQKYAWANSICFLFLVTGIIGFKLPDQVTRELPKVEEIVPVIFTPPPEPPKVVELKEPEPDTNPDPAETAVPVVVAMDAKTVAFSVPVEGPVIFAPAKLAGPPPKVLPKPGPPKLVGPPTPVIFNPNAGDGGSYPAMSSYPRLARERHQQGDVMLYVIIDEAGGITSISIKNSSGSSILDNAAIDWVRRNWRFPFGQTRHFLVPFEFKLQ